MCGTAMRFPRAVFLCSLVPAISLSQASCLRSSSDGEYVQAALNAQVTGFGGCLDEVKYSKTHFDTYPGVVFFEGSCELEHGGTAKPLAARDERGNVFAFGSQVSYNFFVASHPPRDINRDNAIEFALFALRLIGVASGEETILRSAQDLSQVQIEQLGATSEDIRFTRLEALPTGQFQLLVTALSENMLLEYMLILYPETGIVRILSQDEYPNPA